MVSVHDLAYKFWPNEDMERLQRTWQYLYLDSNAERGYHFKRIKNAEDAAALIAIAATDPKQIEQFQAGEQRWVLGMYNDGRSIETMAALDQYHFEDVQSAMSLITDHFMAQDPARLSVHDQALLNYIMSAATLCSHNLFEQGKLIKLADFCVLYDRADYTPPHEKIGKSHFPAHMAIAKLMAKAQDNLTNAALLDACKSYLPFLMSDPVNKAECVADGVYLIEMLKDKSQFDKEAKSYKESIEHHIAQKFNSLTRVSRTLQTSRLQRLYPQINACFRGFITEYGAEPDPTSQRPPRP